MTTRDGDHRLPCSAAPRRYELWLAPDLAAARFTGTARIELEILEPLEEIVMNAVELELRDAVVLPGWSAPSTQVSSSPLAGSEGALACRVELDPQLERVRFVLPNRLEPGRVTLACAFNGILNDRLHGFYRSVFTAEDGSEQAIATTQFEQTDARRAFPCFDEPDRKAVFAVSLDEPPGMLAISNGAEVSATALPSGGRRVHFSETIPMSSYLVAFVVGPLEATKPVDAGGTPLRIVHVPGRGHLVQPAIDAAVHALEYLQSYFAIPYPGDKVDLVALPDFASGAMENLGCVTFREAILLADPGRAGRRDLERLAEVVEHELAHMWFGDLVTMRWWNGIWLNEAFATFMSLRCLDDYRPDWDVFLSFARSRSTAFAVDGLHATRAIEYEVRSPDEVGAMFDVLTYEKGASVLWMIEQYLGADRFRDGVRHYLTEHRLGNTETSDLWAALQAASADEPTSGVPIERIMDSWIFQGGHPVVTVRPAGRNDGGAPAAPGGARDGAAAAGGSAIELTQSPFSYLPAEDAERLGLIERSAIGSDWLVPVLVGSPGSGVETRLLLGSSPARLELDGACPPVVNAGGSGFYRSSYDSALRGELIGSLGALAPLERYDLVADIWAGVVSGREPVASFVEIVESLGEEDDPDVWALVTSALSTLDLVASPAERPALAAWVRRLLAPRLAELGWERGEDEDERAPLLRATLIAALGNLGEDNGVIARARALVTDDLDEGTAVQPDLATALLAVAVAHGRRAEFEAVVARWRAQRDPMDAVRHLYALANVRHPDLADELLELSVTAVRTQNAPYLLGGMLANRHISERTWSFIQARFDELARRFPSNSIPRMLDGLPGLAELDDAGRPRHLDDVVAFYRERVRGGRRRLVAQSIERLAVDLRLAETLRGELSPLLTPA